MLTDTRLTRLKVIFSSSITEPCSNWRLLPSRSRQDGRVRTRRSLASPPALARHSHTTHTGPPLPPRPRLSIRCWANTPSLLPSPAARRFAARVAVRVAVRVAACLATSEWALGLYERGLYTYRYVIAKIWLILCTLARGACSNMFLAR